MQDKLLKILTQKDEITWQSLIYNLVRTEQMDPWNIDISLLAKKYLQIINKLKEHNFFISGKVILASAILLKLKSNKLLQQDLYNFDTQLFEQEEPELIDQEPIIEYNNNYPRIFPKTPYQRKKKISVDDLINALQKALEVEKRRTLRKLREQETSLEIPEQKINITQRIKELLKKIKDFFKIKQTLTFTELVNSNRKQDKLATFIPLLHLTNQQKIDLIQKEHFGEINIILLKK